MAFKGNSYTETQKPIPPAGTHVAICYSIIDLGTHMKAFPGQEPSKTPLMHISWEFPMLQEVVFKQENGPQRLGIFQEYTVSLGDKAKLNGMLKSWRGVQKIVDLEKELPNYLGQPCMINVIHAPSKKTQGIIYANIANNGAGIMRMVEGMPHPGKAKNPLVYFELNPDKPDWVMFQKVPAWLQKKIRESFEWPLIIQKWGPEPVAPTPEPTRTATTYVAPVTQTIQHQQNLGGNEIHLSGSSDSPPPF